MRRSAVAFATAGLLGLALSGCSAAQPAQDFETAAKAAGCSYVKSGAVVDSVEVSTEFGKAPSSVSVPEGLQVNKGELRVVSAANADRFKIAKKDWLVSAKIAAYDAATGKQLYKGESAEPVVAGGTVSQNPLGAFLNCVAKGDRVIAGIGGEAGNALSMQLGGTGKGVILLMDVASVLKSEAEGAVRPLPNGYPEVVKDEKLNFGVVLPPTAAPTESSSAVRIAGTGREITANDMLIVRAITVTWDGEVEGQGLTQYGPESDGLALREELTGKHVGDEVVIIDTSDESAVRVHVVDVLSALKVTQ